MVVKTFRGLLGHNTQDQIRLQTIKGKVGYKIIKFQAITTAPGATTAEVIVKAYKTSQTSIDAVIDFTDSDLLGVVFWSGRASSGWGAEDTIIFDNEIFNQDIYITAQDVDSNRDTNYYIELEVIPLTDHAAEYATLKDIRTQRTIT